MCFIVIDIAFDAYSHPDSAVSNVRLVKRKDVGALLLAYPTHGLSHCLDQDKQLEIAHVVKYCREARDDNNDESRVQYTQCGRFGCVLFWSEFARFVR